MKRVKRVGLRNLRITIKRISKQNTVKMIIIYQVKKKIKIIVSLNLKYLTSIIDNNKSKNKRADYDKVILINFNHLTLFRMITIRRITISIITQRIMMTTIILQRIEMIITIPRIKLITIV